MIPRDRTLVSKYRTEMSEILCQEPHGAVKTDERCHRGVFIHRLLYASHALRTQLSLSLTHTHTDTHTQTHTHTHTHTHTLTLTLTQTNTHTHTLTLSTPRSCARISQNVFRSFPPAAWCHALVCLYIPYTSSAYKHII